MKLTTHEKRQPIANLTPDPIRQIGTPYLKADEAVVYLRLGSINALYRLIDEHQLPHGRRGRFYLFDIRKLDRWVEMCGQVELSSMVGRRRAG